MTTLAAAFPRLGPRSDRSMLGLELGVEPPIRLGDDRLDRSERRRASLRWLAGAALTGLCGVTLIGAALYFDLDSQYDFAEAPEFATAAPPTDVEEEGVSPGKGDRLLRPVDIVSDKQTYKVPTTIKIGDKEVVKERAVHPPPDDADHDADRLFRRGATFQSAQARQPGRRTGRSAGPGPDAGRCGSDVPHSGPRAGRSRAGDGRVVAGRSAGPGRRDHEGADGRAENSGPIAASPALADAHDPGRLRLACRPLRLCDGRQP